MIFGQGISLLLSYLFRCSTAPIGNWGIIAVLRLLSNQLGQVPVLGEVLPPKESRISAPSNNAPHVAMSPVSSALIYNTPFSMKRGPSSSSLHFVAAEQARTETVSSASRVVNESGFHSSVNVMMQGDAYILL